MTFPDDHQIMQSARVQLVWDGQQWIISRATLERDPDGAHCSYGLHLDDAGMRARCQREMDRAELAAVPSRQTVAARFERDAL